MASEPVTTLYDFQLSMLRPMCRSAPAQAGELLDRIGATHADTAIAEARWWFGDATNNFTTIAEHITVWGAPDSEHVERCGDMEVRSARWDLPFWPDLQFEFRAMGRHRRLFHRLLRRSGVPVRFGRDLDSVVVHAGGVSGLRPGPVRARHQPRVDRERNRLRGCRPRVRAPASLPSIFRLGPAAIRRAGARTAQQNDFRTDSPRRNTDRRTHLGRADGPGCSEDPCRDRRKRL